MENDSFAGMYFVYLLDVASYGLEKGVKLVAIAERVMASVQALMTRGCGARHLIGMNLHRLVSTHFHRGKNIQNICNDFISSVSRMDKELILEFPSNFEGYLKKLHHLHANIRVDLEESRFMFRDPGKI